MVVSYSGSSNFVIKSYSQSGDYTDLLINEIGAYEGTVTSYLDFEKTQSLEINASGNWNIHFAPLSEMARASNGSVFTGDNVVYIDEPSISKLHITHDGDSNFVVKAIGTKDSKLLVNEIGSYDGTVKWNEGGAFFIVSADGDWTISW